MNTNEKKNKTRKNVLATKRHDILNLSWCHCYLFLFIFFVLLAFRPLETYSATEDFHGYHAHLHCHITLLQQQRDGDGLHRRHPFEAHLGNKALRALTKKGEGPYGSTTLICQYIYIFIYHIMVAYNFCL